MSSSLPAGRRQAPVSLGRGYVLFYFGGFGGEAFEVQHQHLRHREHLDLPCGGCLVYTGGAIVLIAPPQSEQRSRFATSAVSSLLSTRLSTHQQMKSQSEPFPRSQSSIYSAGKRHRDYDDVCVAADYRSDRAGIFILVRYCLQFPLYFQQYIWRSTLGSFPPPASLCALHRERPPTHRHLRAHCRHLLTNLLSHRGKKILPCHGLLEPAHAARN
jgi:hypothetical protein